MNTNDNTVPIDWFHGPIDPSIIRQECLHQLFETSADKFSNNLAVIYGDLSITYKELESKSNKLAHYLRSMGIKKGDCVGIILNRSIDLYTSILAIMKVGAAYVPMDPSYPPDRISYIIEDCKINTVLTVSLIADKCSLASNIIKLDEHIKSINDQPDTRLLTSEIGITSEDLSYIIYTSGSTGRPKGVQIQHKSACNLVRASHKIYQVVPDDRVYQGFTTAFDASVEELWMAFSNGATLVPATPEMVQAGLDLPKLMAKAGITVLSCVPTLLSMFEDDIPTLRLLIVGGEDCPQHLISRWTKPGRRMLNTYGPTEATVIATHSECIPGKSVTIGRPLSNYSIYILNENLEATAIGEVGELYIGGIGLSKGYLNRDDLTAERFIPNPLVQLPTDPERLYKSGDLARFNEQGEIEFLGRADTQVKIRGFRVELSEIEVVLSSVPNVRTSVVSVHEMDGVQSLIAYIMLQDISQALDLDAVYNILHERLPHYMIPSYIEIIDNIPTLPSGKADRKKLPPPSGRKLKSNKTYVAPETEVEKLIAKIWSEVFKSDSVSITDDFFNDLGGHSLIAAIAVSKLRENPCTSNLAVSDIYKNPTIKELAHVIEIKNTSKIDTKKKEKAIRKPNKLTHGVCGLFQGVSIYLYYLLLSIPFIGIYLFTTNNIEWSFKGIEKLGLLSLIAVIAYIPITLIIALIVKWTVIGRFKEGSYPLWGSYYFRWWIVRLSQSLVPIHLLTGTPLMSVYCKLMGAKIGSNCYIGTNHIVAFDLISIDDNSSLGLDSNVLGYIVEDGMLKLGKIEIGKNCYIGTNSVLSPNTKMLDNTQLGEQSMLPESAVIPKDERWIGSPASKDKDFDSDLKEMAKAFTNSSKEIRFFFGTACFVAQWFLELVPAIAMLPGTILMVYLYKLIGNWSILSAPIIAILFNLFMCIEIALIKKLLIGKIKPGQYKLYSSFYFRKWIVDQLMSMTLGTMHSLYATLYTPPFLRLIGTKIGKNVEVSTVSHISPDLLFIDDGSFLADATLVGTPKIHMGLVTLAETKIGKKTFIGNSGLVPINTTIGDNCLIGVLSTPPKDKKVADGTSWLGSPAIFLPKRDINNDFSKEETYSPTKALYAKRYFIEFFRLTLPITIDSILVYGLIVLINIAKGSLSASNLFFIFPFLALGMELLGTLFVVLMKIILIGKYIPRVKPLWSTFVWRSELVTALYETISVPGFLSILSGTPFICWVMKLFGTKVGKRVFLDSTFISEFDLVEIADEANINYNCTLQTHLFEDRVMKMSYVKIGNNCSVGCGSVVLYDTEMHDGSSIGSLSLLMKGESLPKNTQWNGIPVERS